MKTKIFLRPNLSPAMAQSVPKSMRAHLLMLDMVPSAPISRPSAFWMTGNKVLIRPPSMLSLIVPTAKANIAPGRVFLYSGVRRDGGAAVGRGEATVAIEILS